MSYNSDENYESQIGIHHPDSQAETQVEPVTAQAHRDEKGFIHILCPPNTPPCQVTIDFSPGEAEGE